MDIYVTHHAIERFIERVRPCSPDEAKAALSSPFIQRAADFGAQFVKLGTGHHVVIREHRVVTVRPASGLASMSMASDWRHDLAGKYPGVRPSWARSYAEGME